MDVKDHVSLWGALICSQVMLACFLLSPRVISAGFAFIAAGMWIVIAVAIQLSSKPFKVRDHG